MRREHLTQAPIARVFRVRLMAARERGGRCGEYLRRSPPELCCPCRPCSLRSPTGPFPLAWTAGAAETSLRWDGNVSRLRFGDCLSLPQRDGPLRVGGPVPVLSPSSGTKAGEPGRSEAPLPQSWGRTDRRL